MSAYCTKQAVNGGSSFDLTSHYTQKSTDLGKSLGPGPWVITNSGYSGTVT